MNNDDLTDCHARFSILNSQFYIRTIRWAFARFYREFAWTYDAVAAAVSVGRWGAWGRAALPHLRGRVLELGCGTGNLQRALASRPATWAVGLDASRQMLAITRRKVAASGQSANLARALAQALPFSATSFDSIVATFPTEYIIDMATLAELRRVLRPGGRVVVALAASFSSDGLYHRLLDLLYRATLQRPPGEQPLGAPVSLLGQRLADLGFTVAERWEPVANNQVHLVIAEYMALASLLCTVFPRVGRKNCTHLKRNNRAQFCRRRREYVADS